MGKLRPPIFCLFYVLYTILITLCSTPIFIHSVTLDSDTRVLRDMKRSIDPNSIPPNSFLSSWEFAMDPCETTGWQFLGVLCSFPLDNSPSRITAIELDGSGYEEFIAPSIRNLTELTIINLSKNNFCGPIPGSISNLKKLTRLLLSNNFLTGNIPTGLKTLKKFESLDISFNTLLGSIPSRMGGLRSLTSLNMASNGLTGRIVDLSRLCQLRTLDLSRNHIYGGMPNVPENINTQP